MSRIPVNALPALPTPTQLLLLRATLRADETALTAWREWQAVTDIENLGDDSAVLLPLLLRSLEQHGIENSQLQRYKSVSRHDWVRSQFIITRGGQLLAVLAAAHIPSLVLDGVALSMQYYPDSTARPVHNFQVGVREAQAVPALQLLLESGYRFEHRTALPSLAGLVSVADGVRLMPPNGEERMVLRWRIFGSDESADPLWFNAAPLSVAGQPTRTLSAEDSLLAVCDSAGRWNGTSTLLSIADAISILRGSLSFDWQGFLGQSRRQHRTIPATQMLRCVQQAELDLVIPEDVMATLEQMPVPRAERREWLANALPPAARPAGLSFWLRWLAYQRWNTRQPAWRRPFSLPRYLQYRRVFG